MRLDLGLRHCSQAVLRGRGGAVCRTGTGCIPLLGLPLLERTKSILAAELEATFADGVRFVGLAPVSDPAPVMPALAQELGLRETGHHTLLAQVQRALLDRQLLLVLDTFEQVLPAAGDVAELLRAAPGIKVVVTTREPLHLSGEHEFPVPPLTLPDPSTCPTLDQLTQYAAIALFIARAKAVKPDFEVTQTTAGVVAQICVRLDGLPLAIELAAARSKLLLPAALLDRLTSRLQLLTGGPRDLPIRQRTIRATIDWSYALLDVPEQRLFAFLAVFVGRWTLEAAEVVCDAAGDLGRTAPDGLQSLHDEGQAPRFTMLQTIREYAQERLSTRTELAVLHQQHAGYYTRLVEAAAADLTGQGQTAALQALESEHDNLRAALDWTLEAGVLELAGRLGSALGRFWWIRGYLSERRRALEAIIAKRAALPTAITAKLLDEPSAIAIEQGEYLRAATLNDECLVLYRRLHDQHGLVSALNVAGWLGTWQGDYGRAQAALDECMAVIRELDYPRFAAVLLSHLGWVALLQNDRMAARGYFDESLQVAHAIGSDWAAAWARYSLGQLALAGGNRQAAERSFRQSLQIWQAAEARSRMIYGLAGQASAAATRAQALSQDPHPLGRIPHTAVPRSAGLDQRWPASRPTASWTQVAADAVGSVTTGLPRWSYNTGHPHGPSVCWIADDRPPCATWIEGTAMAVPASDLWAKIQKELSGKGNLEQLAILQRYLDAWPDEWKGPYQELKARLTKLVRKLQTIESVKSSGARDDPFHVPRGGDAQIGFIGLTNSGRSALVSTLTHARLEVSDYPFTTHVPAPGMLRHQDAALQLVDTPAVVPGLALGAGPGQRLVQLIRTMDAVAVVIDLARDPLEQVGVIHSELAAAKVLLRPGPVDVVLALKGKGGITFRGTAITKAERSVAARLLAEHGIVHAEVVVRRQFVADDLAAQLVGTRLLPALIVGSKNDVPGAGNALTLLRAQYDAYTVIDVNFLDAANFEQLKTSLFDVLGAVRVFVLDRPDADAARTTLIVPRASSVADLIARRWPGRTTQAAVARVWGPSAKYPGQPVGLEHLVADGDSVYLQL